jgi:hypothetical protein
MLPPAQKEIRVAPACKRAAHSTYYKCTIIGSLMRVSGFPVRAEFFPGEV